MWINESVFAAAYTYKWGVALPVWWAAGLSFQIALMAVLGILAKLRVPNAHTSLEIIKIRYGKYAHFVFIVLNIINNIFGCGSMILAGSQLVTGISGIHVVAAIILIPAGGKFMQGHYEDYKMLISLFCSCYIHGGGRSKSNFPHGLPAHYHRFDFVGVLLDRGVDK
jgi:Na+/proline symporter